LRRANQIYSVGYAEGHGSFYQVIIDEAQEASCHPADDKTEYQATENQPERVYQNRPSRILAGNQSYSQGWQ
jgi:hypothetical protein